MKKSLLLFITGLFLSCLWSQTATQPTGEGTESNPYQITSLENLYWLTINDDAWDKHYIQLNDIDASATAEWNDVDTDTTVYEGWWPIHRFEGVYDGNYHTISGLTIDRLEETKQGFIDYTFHGMIKNLGIINGSIRGGSGSGPLVGGLYDQSSAINCYSNCNVYSEDYGTGGLIGKVETSIVQYCYASGNVTGPEKAGGLIGYVNDHSLIQYSYCSGTVTTSDNSGGFCGYNCNISLIENCYSLSPVIRVAESDDTNIAGFCGYMYNSQIKNCYSTGSVTYNGADNPTEFGFVAYIVAGNDHLTTGNYWDIETSGQTSTGGTEGQYATGKNTAQMKQQATFVDWDFNTIWNINENTSYPFLRNPNVYNTDPLAISLSKDLCITNTWPNPIIHSDGNKIEIYNKKAHHIFLKIYNIKGQLINELTSQQKGFSTLNWNGRDFQGNRCPSGVYFFTLTDHNNSSVKKVCLIK